MVSLNVLVAALLVAGEVTGALLVLVLCSLVFGEQKG